jgi:DNA-binding response OmpR family regulator
MDVCMPDLDGFQLAAMIREHPRFQKTAMIFISAIHLTDMDRLRGYEMGAVDYVPVPVIPEVLRAKVRIFVELYRKTRQLEKMNAELEERVSPRSSRPRRRGFGKARKAGVSRLRRAAWAHGIGTAPPASAFGMTGNTASSGLTESISESRPKTFAP